MMSISQLEISLAKRIGQKNQVLISSILSNISNHFPNCLRFMIPSRFANLFAGFLIMEKKGISKVEPWLDYGMRCDAGAKLSFSYLADQYLAINFTKEIEKILDPESIRWGITFSERIRFIRSWSFWRLNHSSNRETLVRIKSSIEAKDDSDFEASLRFLPEHTTNMGHLGCLYLYINLYSRIDPTREIQIWPDLAPNQFYLNKLIEVSKLKVHTQPGAPNLKKLNFLHTDNLLMSRVSKSNWRFEANGAAGLGQDFPEYELNPEFFIELNSDESNLALLLLCEQGFDPSKWFIILHIREDSKGYEHGGQARDSKIENYGELIKVIHDLGGQVVRMGNSSFPKANFEVPVFDYAHSASQSQIQDCWLWANCKWWVGNANGASFAVLAFNKPRMIVDQWFWDANGRNQDLYIPKVLFDLEKNRLLTVSETLTSPISRNMNKGEIIAAGCELICNDELLIAKAAVEMYEMLQRKFLREKYSELDLNFYQAMQVSKYSPRMSLPNEFIQRYSEFLLD